MGEFNVVGSGNPREVRAFTSALLRDLKALEKMLAGDMLEADIRRIGAEQELCLIDRYWRPAPILMELLERLNDRHYTTELAKFNLEINLDPLEFAGDCLIRLERQLNTYLTRLRKIDQSLSCDIILTGILPTIRGMDLEKGNMAPVSRYKELFNSLRRLRGGLFEYRISGDDELICKQNFPTLEFCNTSYQIHLQVSPADFADAYNFSKLVTAPLLAAATNSPLLFGRRLWRETRIALFQQAVDTRNISHHFRENTSRVSFQRQWVQESILEVFRDDIARFRVLLCARNSEDALEVLKKGGVPKLQALRVFNGTVYRWNRACYGIIAGKPHLRIENRVLPSGPTVVDQVANSAFWLGMLSGITDTYRHLPEKIDFAHAASNFIKAARIGLEAKFRWLKGKDYSAEDLILQELLPLSREGLRRSGITPVDADRYLGIVEQRVRSRRTGSQWILTNYNKLLAEENCSTEEALVAVTAGIVSRQQKGRPVHEWDWVTLEESGYWIHKYWRVEHIMSTDLFTVQKDDLVDLAACIMDWKHIRHVPVEDENGCLVGLITSGILLKHYADTCTEVKKMLAVSDIMIHDPIFVPPETLTLDAVKIMKKHRVGCLPVVKGNRLAGIVTEHDLMNISARLLEEFSRHQ